MLESATYNQPTSLPRPGPRLDPSPTPRAAEFRRLRVDRCCPIDYTPDFAPRETTLFELLFIEEGSGVHRVGTEELPAFPGDLFLIPPGWLRDPSGLAHTTNWLVAFRADAVGLTRSHSDLYPLVRDELFLDTFFDLGRPNYGAYQTPPGTRPHWIARLTSLEHELRAGDLGSSMAAGAILELLLIDVLRLMRPRLPRFSPQTRPMLVSVFQFIDHRFRAPIGLADVAKAVARSPSYLTDLVRRETGRTVLQWIIERRMAEARRLLLESDARVKDIGQAIGYDDAGHFIRLFSRFHDLPPQQWRRARRDD